MRGVWNTLIIVSALALVVGCQGGGGSGGGAAATAGAGVQSDSGSADDDAGGGEVDAGGGEEGAAITLAWSDPGLSGNGSDLFDLAGFYVYLGSSSGDYDSVFDGGNSREVDVVDLDSGTYYFAGTAYDFFGNESSFSDELVHTVP